MNRYEPAPKWDGRKWRAAVDVFRPGKRGKTTIKGDAYFETRDESFEGILKAAAAEGSGAEGIVSQPTRRAALDGSYLTPIQASVRTGIPKTRLARWRRDGRGPVFVKRGSRIEYPAWELEFWLESWRTERAALEVWGSK